MIMMLIVLVLASLLAIVSAKFSFMKQQKPVSTLPSSSSSVPSSGIIDYIGSTNPSSGETRWSTPLPSFEGITFITIIIIIIIIIN